MWHTLKLCSSQTIYRLFFRCCFWLLYGTARCCHFLKLRYNSQSKRLEEMQYHFIISKLVLLVKCLLIMGQFMNYVVFGFYVWGQLFRVDRADGQNFLVALFIECITVYVLRRTLVFLHSLEDRTLMKQVVNEIIYISQAIDSKFGMMYHGEFSLLGLFLLKLYLVYLLLDAMWYKPYFLWINFLYRLLLEYCGLAYFVYQLILLNWCRNFALFLQFFIKHHEHQSFISRCYHRRLLWFFKLNTRINKLHKCIREKTAWFPSANYLGIILSIFHMELLLECAIYAQDEIENKLYIIADGSLGNALVPLLNVLILGLCTDRLRSEELTLQQHIVIINVMYHRKACPPDHSLQVLHNELSLLIVHQKLEPLYNAIILGITCDREFAFDYFLTVIITALSFLQYSISFNQNVVECVTRK